MDFHLFKKKLFVFATYNDEKFKPRKKKEKTIRQQN